jgi:hypothetical protein
MADAVSSDRPIRPSGVTPEKNARALSASSLLLNCPSMIGRIRPGESVFTRMPRSLAPLPSRSERTYGDFGGCVGSVLRQSFQMQTGRPELDGPTIPRQRERLLYREIDTTCIYTERLVEMGRSCIEREPALDKTVTGHNNIDPAFSFLTVS